MAVDLSRGWCVDPADKGAYSHEIGVGSALTVRREGATEEFRLKGTAIMRITKLAMLILAIALALYILVPGLSWGGG